MRRDVERLLISFRSNGGKHDCLEGHSRRVSAEFRTQRPRQSVDDSVGLHAATRPDLVDQRITVDQPTRKPRDVWYFFVELHDSDVEVVESGFESTIP